MTDLELIKVYRISKILIPNLVEYFIHYTSGHILTFFIAIISFCLWYIINHTVNDRFL